MTNIGQIIIASIIQAFQELRVNKLRTFLSLLGITIGIFCIISVLTSLDSAKAMIQKNVNNLGSDVLYIGRWPWPGAEEGEYRWWDYWRRPSLTSKEVTAVDLQLHDMAYTSICLPITNIDAKYNDLDVSNIRAYALGADFDKVQNIEIESGRYFTNSELIGGNNTIILGSEVYNSLFPTGGSALGKSVRLVGRKFIVIGVMKKVGQNMADFDFDNSILCSYNKVSTVIDVTSTDYNPRLIVRAFNVNSVNEVKDEIRGILRRSHRLRPSQADDFSINQLSSISNMLDQMFATINIVGIFIALFSLLVGAFGIANIMFVTVRDRTKYIGLKKAIGARRASILMEFLLEATVLCVIGGLIGIFIVWILSIIVSNAMDWEITLSFKNFSVGVIVSIIVGVVSGIIPAISASKLDPVVAIRSN